MANLQLNATPAAIEVVGEEDAIHFMALLIVGIQQLTHFSV